MTNFAVVTSIYPPTAAIREIAALKGWTLVVVGDKKTPADWQLNGVVYLSPADQQDLGLGTAEILPWNHYGRKMIGYLYAMQNGADLILDTDDDNRPTKGFAVLPGEGRYATAHHDGFVNVYKYFTDQYVWPRGYPLNLVSETEPPPPLTSATSDVGIWQFLADGDPDVDAIYRLVFDRPVTFAARAPIVLDEGAVCPFNSQNTIFSRDAFPLLYLPAFVTFRFTDILRGFVAQPMLWKRGLRLGFGEATVVQDRNPHDYLEDFASEIPMYLQGERVTTLTREAIEGDGEVYDDLRRAYRRLAENEIVDPIELKLLDRWLDDVETVLDRD